MTGRGLARRLGRLLRAALPPAPRAAFRGRSGRPPAGGPPPPGRSAPHGAADEVRTLVGGLAGADLRYVPHDDGAPDPGEVVWAWVPFDEGDGRGKDRPVLVLGRRGDDLVGLLLSSRDHDGDAADEARHGRSWIDVGSGAWDARGRPSEVRLDRLLLLPPGATRREGAALDRRRFDEVVAAARLLHRS